MNGWRVINKPAATQPDDSDKFMTDATSMVTTTRAAAVLKRTMYNTNATELISNSALKIRDDDIQSSQNLLQPKV